MLWSKLGAIVQIWLWFDPKFQSYSLPISLIKVLTKWGGFPLSVKGSGIQSSRPQVIKLALYIILAFFATNIFSIIGFFLPESRPFIYMDIFKSVGFSNMDFFVAVSLFNIVVVFNLVVFFALDNECKQLEKVCLEMEEVNAKPFCRISYKGKGKLALIEIQAVSYSEAAFQLGPSGNESFNKLKWKEYESIWKLNF